MSIAKHQAGFTFIEVIIVVAIMGLTTLIAFRGLGVTRSQAQFSASIDDLREVVLQERTAADSGINPSGTGDSLTTVRLGRIIGFTPNSSVITSQVLLTNENPVPGSPVTISAGAGDTTNRTIKYGLLFNGPRPIKIAFTRSPIDGLLHATVKENWNPPFTLLDFDPSSAVSSLLFVDPITGRQGNIIIDASTAGVSRKFQ